jgi:inosine-uridine nucleoside N-ribohydrolase
LRLWIDTDVGTNPDDALALALACRHPDVTLVGVSTVNDDDDARAAVGRDVVRSMGGDPGVVVSGRAFHVQALRDARADALLAIGPLTNVARIVGAGLCPSRVGVMGGALARVLHRDAWREIESNFGADPAAAALVLARVDVLLVPLDVTAQVCLDDAQREEVGRRFDCLGRALSSWQHPVCLHDPLALLALAGEPFFTVEARRIKVDRRGRVVARSSGRVHQVVVGVDRDAAVARIFQLLKGNDY